MAGAGTLVRGKGDAVILSQNKRLSELAKLWRESAGSIRRYDPQDPKARVLEACAQELATAVGETAPEWVSIRAVQEFTGLSRQTLIRRCKELEASGEARKRGGGWEVALKVAQSWPRRSRRGATEGVTDPYEFARIAGSEE